MKVRCEYCGSMVDDREQRCPNCGASLPSGGRTANGQPQTIEELQSWYTAHKLPPESITRFFIGKNITEPRAFGIYRDETGEYVVYKNKASGERAVRYRGSDEAYAVGELYQRLRTEIANQKFANSGRSSVSQSSRKRKSLSASMIIPLIFFLMFFISMLFNLFDKRPARGYYHYNGEDYYYQSGTWYYYNSILDDWYEAEDTQGLDEITDENASQYAVYDHSGMPFEDSAWYSESDSDSDWDSDSSWDSDDSWDSGGSDWDSDW